MWLRSLGHHASHVREISLADEPDIKILSVAVESGSVVITKDADFAHLVAAGANCRVVWIRYGNASSTDLIASLKPVWKDIETALADGQQLVEVIR